MCVYAHVCACMLVRVCVCNQASRSVLQTFPLKRVSVHPLRSESMSLNAQLQVQVVFDFHILS